MRGRGLSFFGIVCASVIAAERPAPGSPDYAVQLRVLKQCEDLYTRENCEAVLRLLPSRERMAQDLLPKADGLAGMALARTKQPDQALERVAEYLQDRSRYQPPNWRCYEAAGMAHLAKGDHYEALKLYDWVAQHADGKPKVHAAEGCGQALEEAKGYTKAVEAYAFALDYLRRNFSEYDRDKSWEERLAKARDRVTKLRDAELYGEDFVLYREAETLRRQKKEFGTAREIYLDIIKRFPGTVYAEAAGLYEALCLLEQNDGERAERALSAFYTKDKWGLYRGEALLNLAAIRLDYHADTVTSKLRLDELVSWLDEVPKYEERIRNFSIAGKAAAVTQPPKDEKTRDFWGNVKESAIKPGQIVNRRTCSWYLDSLAEQAWAYRGFLSFLRGDKKGALDCYARMLSHDQASRQLQAEGTFNNYSRLKWGVDHGYLYAYPPELALYTERPKVAVQLADFYYCTMQFSRSQLIAHRLLNDTFGHLSAAQKDYALFVKAASEYRTGQGRQAYATYKRVFERREGTLTEDRAAYAAGNISADIPEANIRDEGLEILRQLAFCGRRNEFVYLARFGYANRLRDLGKVNEGLQLLRNLPKEAGDVYDLAQWILGQQDKSKNPVEQKRGNP